MKENAWEKLWNSRIVDVEHNSDSDKELFLELKRGSGFDVMGEGITYDAFIEQHSIIDKMLFPDRVKCQMDGEASVYEVGCGSGGNLFLFEKMGLQCGGIDFSKSLIEAAKKILRSTDLTCAEADQIPQEPIYDALLSYGVFHYFSGEEYAYRVLEKMYHKTRFSIGLMDIHDKEKEQDFEDYRKATIEDYENRYRNLPKTFYSKDFFRQFASEHGMQIVFTESTLKGYWNNDFIFHCFLYK